MTYEEVLKKVEERTTTSKSTIELNVLERWAIKKQIKRKPTVVRYSHSTIIHTYNCPLCDAVITTSMKYCAECGQAIDWGKK